MLNHDAVDEKWNKLLQDPSPELQMEALTEIGRFYFRSETTSKPKVDFLGAVRNRSNIQTLNETTTTLELPPSLRDVIFKKLDESDSDMQAEAVLALVHWQDEETIGKIKGALNDSNRTVRLAAVQALASMRNMSLIESLLEVARTDQDNLVRAKAISAVDWIGRDQRVEKQQPHAVGAVQTSGGRRVPHLRKVLESLEAIEKDAPSAYTKFLARRARERFAE